MILVVAEHRAGALSRVTWETIAAAQQMAGDLPVRVVVVGTGHDALARELTQADVAEVLAGDHAALAPYTPDGLTMAIVGLVSRMMPAFVLLPHTYQTRDCAPMMAARLRAPLVTDVIGVRGTGRGTTFIRPVFQGKLVAEVRPEGDGPCFVTIQVGAFKADAVRRGGSAVVSPVAVDIDESRIRQRPEAPFQEATHAVDLGQAERIVAVGRGIKSQENLAVAQRLATALRAEVAASRPICDNGWLAMDRQVGSSGQTVAPKLYVALGISGAIQHLVGMKGSKTIVAVNKDAEAPIFEVADYGIVGDLFEIAPAIAAELEKQA